MLAGFAFRLYACDRGISSCYDGIAGQILPLIGGPIPTDTGTVTAPVK
jgi:hypothetical protein